MVLPLFLTCSSFSVIENIGWSSFMLLIRLWFIVPICQNWIFLINHFHSFSLFVTFTWLKLGYWLDLWGKEMFPIYWYITWTLLSYSDTKKTRAVLWELLTNIINILCCQCNSLRSSQTTDNWDEMEINNSSSPIPSTNHRSSWLEIWGQSYFFKTLIFRLKTDERNMLNFQNLTQNEFNKSAWEIMMKAEKISSRERWSGGEEIFLLSKTTVTSL